jgi:ATP-binding cassette subfamily C exporter for protease/lipase
MKIPFFSKDDIQSGELTRSLASLRHDFMWVILFSLIANLLTLTPTIYMLQLYDRVLASQSEMTLLFLTIIVLIFFMVTAFAEGLRSRLLVRVGIKMDRKLNARVFNASFRSQLNQRHLNASEFFNHLTTVRQFLTGNGIIALCDVPWTPIFIMVIFFLHPLLGWLSILFAFIQLGIAFYSQRVTHGKDEDAKMAEQKNRLFLFNKLRNAEPVEAMGMLGHLKKHWLRYHGSKQLKTKIAYTKIQEQKALGKLVRYSMQSFTLAVAALLVIEGKLSPGAMIAANVLMSRALQPLDMIVGSWKSFIEAKKSFLDIDGLLKDFPEEDQDIHYPDPQGKITLKNLVATSPSRKDPILKKLNVSFDKGQVTAIIGPSGSGKSTLARCLLGLWPDTEGLVLLDKTPITNWDKEQLGPHIGYLPQDVELLDGSFAENIGRFYEMDSEKIVGAAKQAGIHEMILKFPQGYDTMIGESGNLLSGGQRQRVALARAIYGDPKIIVLDEPNANLDEVGERSLVDAIRELKKKGSTLFLITHRLNILQVTDHICKMKDGMIEVYGERDDVLSLMKNEATHLKHTKTKSNDPTVH